ncbi:hypothetical protein BH23GEM9_BH23GEM9_07910 [soil metagenome]
MKRHAPNRFRLAFVFMLLTGLSACGGRDEPAVDTTDTGPVREVTQDAVRVTNVDLGTTLGADNRVPAGSATDTFRPSDTIHASVATEGAATRSTLTARWTYEDGQVVDESSQSISPTGPAVTEFHISMPNGFPTGSYQLEILLDGQSMERKSFTVR